MIRGRGGMLRVIRLGWKVGLTRMPMSRATQLATSIRKDWTPTSYRLTPCLVPVLLRVRAIRAHGKGLQLVGQLSVSPWRQDGTYCTNLLLRPTQAASAMTPNPRPRRLKKGRGKLNIKE